MEELLDETEDDVETFQVGIGTVGGVDAGWWAAEERKVSRASEPFYLHLRL